MTFFNDSVRNALQDRVISGLTRRERQAREAKNLRTRTGMALTLAVLIGLAIAAGHGGTMSASFTAFGAALGVGGVLGFLFGVPVSSRTPVNIRRAGTVTVSTGAQSSTKGGDVDATQTNSGGVENAGANSGPDKNNGASGAENSAQAGTASLNSGATDGSQASPDSGASDDEADTPPSRASNLEQVADWVTKLLLGGGLTQMQRIPPKIWQWSRMVALGILGGDQRSNEAIIVAQQAFAAGLLVYGFVLGFFAGFLITKLQLGKDVWQ